jgi:hypothetical protein
MACPNLSETAVRSSNPNVIPSRLEGFYGIHVPRFGTIVWLAGLQGAG